MEELLSRVEVANYFKVNISTVRNWTKQGILKKYGVGDRVYYKRFEIEEVLIQINET
jgi:DNA-binding transcriptional MerR regulator